MYTKMQMDLAWQKFAIMVEYCKKEEEMRIKWDEMAKKSALHDVIIEDIKQGIAHGNIHVRQVNKSLFDN